MTFTDYIFIPFLLLSLGLYYICPLRFRYILLLGISIFFYATHGIEYLPFIIFTILTAWGSALIIQKIHDTEKDRLKEKKKCLTVLAVSVIAVAGILIYVKLPLYGYMLPLGISYYSMSLIGYIADVYWKKEKAETNPLKIALFAFYFPKLIEGPISKHRTNASAICNTGYGISRYEALCMGLQRMLWGFFKKLVIADRLNPFITTVFGDLNGYNGLLLFTAAVFSGIQLYCDFSGCMDIALGISEAFGITLEENFRQPFFSQSSAEFWRRWHITLGVWFKDYIYMPAAVNPALIRLSGKIGKRFGRKAGKNFLTIVALSLVWLLTGLWHGTGLNYIVWGIYWGVIISFSTVCDPLYKKIKKALRIKEDSFLFTHFRMLRTFGLFIIGRIITMPGDLKASAEMIKNIFMKIKPVQFTDGTIFTVSMDKADYAVLIMALLILWYTDRLNEKGISVRKKISALPLPLRWIIYIVAVLAVFIFGNYGIGYDASAFVYMKY